jgi:hypothetical protein
MLMTSVRATALAGVVLATVGLPARAGALGLGGGSCCNEAASACCAPTCCAPVVRTITCIEWVPEKYEACRTVYRQECVQEKYTCYKTECVPETRTRQVVCHKMVPCEQEVTCTVWTCVPTCETRTVCKKVPVCKTVTTIKRKCVDLGHYECRCVEDHSIFSRFMAGGHKPACGDSCDPCGSCCAPVCVPTKVKKVWCPNKVWIEEPCTKTVKCWETVQETVQVTVMKKVPVQQTKKVCVMKCVPECKTETYTALVPKQVAVEATRNVIKCVPVVEKYTACRLVPRCVTKQVTQDCCSVSSAPGCCGGLFGRYRHSSCSCCN